MNTLLIQLTNQKALKLLHELEELHLIRLIKENVPPGSPKLSEKYKGAISKEEGLKLNEHIKKMRSEWDNI
ncbi:MAG TPA: hypothetical protein VHD33_06675 [Legionellaceae bacterium]|nr:hypothetical protein [Legionellaceae bacterium]